MWNNLGVTALLKSVEIGYESFANLPANHLKLWLSWTTNNQKLWSNTSTWSSQQREQNKEKCKLISIRIGWGSGWIYFSLWVNKDDKTPCATTTWVSIRAEHAIEKTKKKIKYSNLYKQKKGKNCWKVLWLAKKMRMSLLRYFGSLCERVENICEWKRAKATSSLFVTNLIPRDSSAILICNEKSKICALIARHQLEIARFKWCSGRRVSGIIWASSILAAPFATISRQLNDLTLIRLIRHWLVSHSVSFVLVCEFLFAKAQKNTIASWSFFTNEREWRRELSWKITSHVCFESLR